MIISIMVFNIGIDITKIIIFPARRTLSDKELCPLSMQILLVNSLMYPTPIILRTRPNKLALSPVFSTRKLKISTTSVK